MICVDLISKILVIRNFYLCFFAMDSTLSFLKRYSLFINFLNFIVDVSMPSDSTKSK